MARYRNVLSPDGAPIADATRSRYPPGQAAHRGSVLGVEAHPPQAGGTSNGEATKTSVFVSYAREDRQRAEQLIGWLEAAGCSVWWDALIDGGQDFAASIEEALERVDAVVVIWSAASVVSHWVRDEAERGRDRGRLVPVTFDGSVPPMGFRQVQSIDLSGGRAGGDIVARAIANVARGSDSALAPHFGTASTRRAIMLGGGAALLAAGGGYYAWQSATTSSGRANNSVAVIPFKNLSGDPMQDYLSDGISEEIRQELMRNKALKVMAPASVTAVVDKAGKMLELAKQLGVSMLLSGTVRRKGERLRVTSELADINSGYTIWADTFDRTMSDVFSVQSEIARAVGGAMAAQTANSETVGITMDPRELGGTENVAAYEAYLRGEAYYRSGANEAAYRAALAQLDTALIADPAYARALSRRATVLALYTSYFARASEYNHNYAEALRSARRAVELAPKMPLAHLALGYVLFNALLDFRGAWEPYRQARLLAPNDPSVQSYSALYFALMDRPDEARQAINATLALDPINPINFGIDAYIRLAAGDFAGALRSGERTRILNPRWTQTYFYEGAALTMLNRHQDALDRFSRDENDMMRFSGLAIAYRKLGNMRAAEAQRQALVSRVGDSGTYQLAEVYAQWDEPEKAFAALRSARHLGISDVSFTKVDPLLSPLRASPKFSALLSEFGFV